MAMPEDVAALVSALPPKTLVLHHAEPEYQHLDYTWGLDAHEQIYPTVIKVLKDAAAAHDSRGGGGGGEFGRGAGNGGRDGPAATA